MGKRSSNCIFISFYTVTFLLTHSVPVFALRPLPPGEEDVPTRRQLEEEFLNAGAEEVPWPPGTGRVAGADEFPEAVRVSLNAAQNCVGRIIALRDHLEWSNYRLGKELGYAHSGVLWEQRGIEQPEPQVLLRVSQALHADPHYLIAGLPEELAYRPGPPGERFRLAMAAQGMVLADIRSGPAARVLDVAWGNTQREITRASLFELAALVKRRPVQMETGYLPSGTLLMTPTGKVGFRPGNPKNAQQRAETLEQALVRRWQVQGQPASQWQLEIQPDRDYGYVGLTLRLLRALPGTYEMAVHYGLIPQNIADVLIANRALTPPEIAQLADSLAKAHDELEELFAENPPLRPPTGYSSIRNQRRMQYTWDLIARFINRERLLLLLDSAPVQYSNFKKGLLLAAFPEEMVSQKEQSVTQLTGAFPEFSERLVRNYVWDYSDPATSLSQARVLSGRIQEIAGKGWIRPVGVQGPVTPQAFSILLLFSSVTSAQELLENFNRRNHAVQTGVRATYSAEFRRLALRIPGLETVPGEEGVGQARDLFHRVIAWRQLTDPSYFENAPDPKSRSTAQVEQFVRPVIEVVTTRLQVAEGQEQLPKSGESLDEFSEKLSEELPAPQAGLEEEEFRSRWARLSSELLRQAREVEQTRQPVRFISDTYENGDAQVLRLVQMSVLLSYAGIPIRFAGVATADELAEAQELMADPQTAAMLADHVVIYRREVSGDHQRALDTAKMMVFDSTSQFHPELIINRFDPLSARWFIQELDRLNLRQLFSSDLCDEIEALLTSA